MCSKFKYGFASDNNFCGRRKKTKIFKRLLINILKVFSLNLDCGLCCMKAAFTVSLIRHNGDTDS